MLRCFRLIRFHAGSFEAAFDTTSVYAADATIDAAFHDFTIDVVIR